MSPELQELNNVGASKASNDGPDAHLLDRIPEELDREKFERGKQFFQRNVVGCVRGMFLSLVIGLSLHRFLDDLVATGETTKPADAFRRYFHTVLHVLKWHYGDIWDRNSSARKSIMFVRYRHFKAREYLVKKDDGQIKKSSAYIVESSKQLKGCQACTSSNGNSITLRNSGHLPVHISQYDMSLVQAGFIGIIILYPHRCGIKCTESELDDFVYVWRWIGYLLGIEDNNNICVGGFQQAYRICKCVELDLILPSLANPPEQFEPMANAFLEGMKQATRSMFVFKLNVIVALAFKCSGKTIPFALSLMDRLRMFNAYVIANAMLYIPGLTRFLNYIFEKAHGCRKMT